MKIINLINGNFKLIVITLLVARVAFVSDTARADRGKWTNTTEIMKTTELVEMEGSTPNPIFYTIMKLYKECMLSTVSNHSTYFSDDPINEGGPHCKKLFDGFVCWDSTPGGATAFQSCPGYIVGFEPSLIVYKKCVENGTWGVHEETSKVWTNYTSCVNTEDLKLRRLINNIYIIGYILSSASLSVSLWLFYYYKTLHCFRIQIHVQWFTANLVSNILWIIWHKGVVENVNVVQDNPLWCQTLYVLTVYFTAATNLWMFNEGFYLFLALVVVFVEEQATMPWLIFIGWIFPAILNTAYTYVRFTHPESRVRCWMDYHDSFWIITVPILISLLVSIGIFIKVLCVVNDKTSNTGGRRRMMILKTVRAAFILLTPCTACQMVCLGCADAESATRGNQWIPLFGLQYILMPFSPAPGSTFHAVYQVASAVCVSFQGFFVALLFCFTNHEVLQAVRAHIARLKRGRSDNMPMTGVTAGESIVHIRDHLV